MSRAILKSRLEDIRYQERQYFLSTALAIGGAALNGIEAVNNYYHFRAAETGIALFLGALGLYTGFRGMSEAHTAASLEAVLAQDELHQSETVAEESQLQKPLPYDWQTVESSNS